MVRLEKRLEKIEEGENFEEIRHYVKVYIDGDCVGEIFYDTITYKKEGVEKLTYYDYVLFRADYLQYIKFKKVFNEIYETEIKKIPIDDNFTPPDCMRAYSYYYVEEILKKTGKKIHFEFSRNILRQDERGVYDHLISIINNTYKTTIVLYSKGEYKNRYTFCPPYALDFKRELFCFLDILINLHKDSVNELHLITYQQQIISIKFGFKNKPFTPTQEQYQVLFEYFKYLNEKTREFQFYCKYEDISYLKTKLLNDILKILNELKNKKIIPPVIAKETGISIIKHISDAKHNKTYKKLIVDMKYTP